MEITFIIKKISIKRKWGGRGETKKEILASVTTQTDLQGLMLSEISNKSDKTK